MKPEIRDQWADALESDEYKQGTGYLTHLDEDGSKFYCCLGVLCDMAVKAGVIPEPGSYVDENGTVILHYGAGKCDAFLPREVQTWAGLKESTVSLSDGDRTLMADYWNDIQGAGFNTIAGMIRSQL